MDKISGVNKSKAIKYGKPFLQLIREYVEDNEIERPTEIVIRQVANKSKNKVAIIQAIDRKMPFTDIAGQAEMNMESLLEEMNTIVDTGTKLDISYWIDDNLDEDTIDDIFDYFHEAEDSDIEKAFIELRDEDITREEVMLVRVKFISEVVN
jgi:ATP-dependent DNA helicase RecQ